MARDPLNLAHSYLKNFVFIAWPILQWQIWIQVIFHNTEQSSEILILKIEMLLEFQNKTNAEIIGF